MLKEYELTETLGAVFGEQPKMKPKTLSKKGLVLDHAIIPTRIEPNISAVARSIEHIYEMRGLEITACEKESKPHKGHMRFNTYGGAATIDVTLRSVTENDRHALYLFSRAYRQTK